MTAVGDRSFMKTPFLLGRLLFGDDFLYNGIHHFRKHKNMAQYGLNP